MWTFQVYLFRSNCFFSSQIAPLFLSLRILLQMRFALAYSHLWHLHHGIKCITSIEKSWFLFFALVLFLYLLNSTLFITARKIKLLCFYLLLMYGAHAGKRIYAHNVSVSVEMHTDALLERKNYYHFRWSKFVSHFIAMNHDIAGEKKWLKNHSA